MDEWPLGWSGGWLLEQAALLDTDPKKFWDGGIGFIDEPSEDDPWWDESVLVEPPEGWENLPVYSPGEEVSDAER